MKACCILFKPWVQRCLVKKFFPYSDWSLAWCIVDRRLWILVLAHVRQTQCGGSSAGLLADLAGARWAC